MAGEKLTIKLTDDQQKQVQAATGRSITELNIDLAAMRELTEQELEQATGGADIWWQPVSRD
jgi:hypothetical protein